MKYNIQAGKHPAQVNLTMDGKGGFTGVISHTEFGDGQITGGKQNGEELTGSVVLDGHTADFEAKISGASISGRVSLNWLMGQDFTGVQAA
jgi:hypothetical protein